MLRYLEWTQKSGFQKSNMYVMGQAGTMVQERLTELEHAAVARMDTREWLVQKVNVLHKLDRLVQ